MPATVLDDVIVPEIFTGYVIDRTAELSDFFTSGIISNMAELNVGNGGSQVQMPFWNDLTGDDQVLSTDTNLNVHAITADKDVAVVNARAHVYGAKDLAGALAGSDPLDAIASLMAAKWSRSWQKTLIATLNGAMGALAAESPPVNTLDISALSGDAGLFDAMAFIDATHQLGDAAGRVTAIAVHSATMANMQKQNLIAYIPNARGEVVIPTYMGKRVIVDDGMPVSNGVFTSYLFGAGAVGYGEGQPKVPTEVERNALIGGGEEYLVSRRHYVLHPRGVAWTPVNGVPNKDTPSDAELANPANWSRAYEHKNIRIVRFLHRNS